MNFPSALYVRVEPNHRAELILHPVVSLSRVRVSEFHESLIPKGATPKVTPASLSLIPGVLQVMRIIVIRFPRCKLGKRANDYGTEESN